MNWQDKNLFILNTNVPVLILSDKRIDTQNSHIDKQTYKAADLVCNKPTSQNRTNVHL